MKVNMFIITIIIIILVLVWIVLHRCKIMLETTRKQKTIQATSSKSRLQTMPGLFCFKKVYI